MTENTRLKTEDQKRHRRELELIAAGFALAQGGGKNIVTSSLVRGSLAKDVDDFVEGIRSGSGEPVINFLAVRGAVIEKGKHAIDAIVDAIKKQNAEDQIGRVCRRFNHKSTLEDLPSLISQVRDMLGELEEIEREF